MRSLPRISAILYLVLLAITALVSTRYLIEIIKIVNEAGGLREIIFNAW